MNTYLAKILEMGIDEVGEVKLSAKQTKDIINSKLTNKGGKKIKNRPKQPDNGMTEEEMDALQQKLFEKARQYSASDEEDDEAQNQGTTEQQQQYMYYQNPTNQQEYMQLQYQYYYQQ